MQFFVILMLIVFMSILIFVKYHRWISAIKSLIYLIIIIIDVIWNSFGNINLLMLHTFLFYWLWLLRLEKIIQSEIIMLNSIIQKNILRHFLIVIIINLIIISILFINVFVIVIVTTRTACEINLSLIHQMIIRRIKSLLILVFFVMFGKLALRLKL